jgi:PAS domain-containing protein
MNILERIDRALVAYRDRTALREELCKIRDGILADERKAQFQRELLETMVNSLPLAILVIDDTGKIVFTHSEAQALFFDGKKPEGQNFLQLLGTVHEGLRQALLSETDHRSGSRCCRPPTAAIIRPCWIAARA